MRILTGIDVPFQPFGGSLICCDDWYSNLPEGVEVRFLTLPPPPTVGKWWSITDVKMLDIVKVRDPAGYQEYLRKLGEAIKAEVDDFKPDIIHAQHLNYGFSRAIADLKLDIPSIGICHGTDVQAAVGNDYFLENMKVIAHAMDALVFPNQKMTDDFLRVYGGEATTYINALGIPDRYYGSPATPSYDGKRELRVLYAGRLLSWKGVDIAIAALAATTHPMHLTVTGNEDQAGYKATLLGLIAEHGLEERVTFRDQLPRDELMQAFHDFDVIVFPSTKLEAFSLTVVEAQAAGLPIIYGPAGGIEDTAGGAGIALTASTAPVLAEALDTLCMDPTILADLQKRGLANAEKYRISASRRRLFELSQSIIDGSTKSRGQ